MKSKICLVVGAVLITVHATSQSNPSHIHQILSFKMDSALSVSIEQNEHAAISAAVYQADKVDVFQVKGFAEKEKGIAADETTLFRIASITKPMTAVAIMQLYERGKLQLSDPIQKYIPEYPTHPEGSITIRQLLSHSSGIAHYKNGKDGFSTQSYPTLTNALTRFWKRKLQFAPGTAFQYSTYGFMVLGVIIERVSGLDYESYLKENIWMPAGMKNTRIERSPNQSGSAHLYFYDKKRLKKDRTTDLSMKIAGGGVLSTCRDIALFGKALLDYTLLSKATFELMSTNQKIRDPEAGNGYALGWYIYAEDASPFQVIGHSGSQAGQSGHLLIDTKHRLVSVVLSNTRGQWSDTFAKSAQFRDWALKMAKL